eukprot:m.74627 g.74627  ORF g.74627 m.74627 type:complete len:305 (+) comp8063_c0_seq2:1102-2016(+)
MGCSEAKGRVIAAVHKDILALRHVKGGALFRRLEGHLGPCQGRQQQHQRCQKMHRHKSAMLLRVLLLVALTALPTGAQLERQERRLELAAERLGEFNTTVADIELSTTNTKLAHDNWRKVVDTGKASTTSMQTTVSTAVTSGDALLQDIVQTLEARVNFLKANMPVATLPWTECAFPNIESGADSGTIVSCSFVKKSDDSVVELTWNGNIRVICNACSRRYYLLIDGVECTSPKSLDTMLYDVNNDNHHRPGYITGMCTHAGGSPILAGPHTLSLATSGEGDAYTGWQSTSRLIIEERSLGIHK